jgi:predicted amidohydrolase YtcJ
VGKRADFVVVSGDPVTTPPDALLRLRVLATYVGGRCAATSAERPSCGDEFA